MGGLAARLLVTAVAALQCCAPAQGYRRPPPEGIPDEVRSRRGDLTFHARGWRTISKKASGEFGGQEQAIWSAASGRRHVTFDLLPFTSLPEAELVLRSPSVPGIGVGRFVAVERVDAGIAGRPSVLLVYADAPIIEAAVQFGADALIISAWTVPALDLGGWVENRERGQPSRDDLLHETRSALADIVRMVADAPGFEAWRTRCAADGRVALQPWSPIPSDLDEALRALDALLPPKAKDRLRAAADSSEFHMGLGMHLRNRWHLWTHKTPLNAWFGTRGLEHPDDISSVVIETYRRQIRGEPLEVEAQIRKIRQWWCDGAHGQMKPNTAPGCPVQP